MIKLNAFSRRKVSFLERVFTSAGLALNGKSLPESIPYSMNENMMGSSKDMSTANAACRSIAPFEGGGMHLG